MWLPLAMMLLPLKVTMMVGLSLATAAQVVPPQVLLSRLQCSAQLSRHVYHPEAWLTVLLGPATQESEGEHLRRLTRLQLKRSQGVRA